MGEQIANLNDLLIKTLQKYDEIKNDPGLKKTRSLLHELKGKITLEPPKKRRKVDAHVYGIIAERKSKKEKYMDHYKIFDDKYVSQPTNTSNDVIENKMRTCSICSKKCVDKHHFYELLCTTCGDINYSKRTQTANLTGKIALVTGGRIKVGYEICLKLLRAGGTVLLTSRFPHDTLIRYMMQSDFSTFKDKLHIFCVDFLDTKSADILIEFLIKSYPKLDILINNACQTVRKPKEYYEHLRHNELKQIKEINDEFIELLQGTLKIIQLDTSTMFQTKEQSLIPLNGMITDSTIATVEHFSPGEIEKYFPQNLYDFNHQQTDLRTHNSWIMKLEEVSNVELAEVHIINSYVPYILIAKLKNLMIKANDKTFIINVSSMEGKFNRQKHVYHPHTNMMKAALNMLTHTSAEEYKSYNIFMNSVDTGWITNEYPIKVCSTEHTFNGILDEIDGASRCLDPIFVAINHGLYEYGNFYKDYMKSSW